MLRGGMISKKLFNILNLINIVRIYFFLQLFLMPILLYFFSGYGLMTTLNDLGVQAYSKESLVFSLFAYIAFFIGTFFPTVVIEFDKPDESSNEWMLYGGYLFLILGFVYKIIKVTFGFSLVVTKADIGFFNEYVTYFSSINLISLAGLFLLGIHHYESLNAGKKRVFHYPIVGGGVFVTSCFKRFHWNTCHACHYPRVDQESLFSI